LNLRLWEVRSGGRTLGERKKEREGMIASQLE